MEVDTCLLPLIENKLTRLDYGGRHVLAPLIENKELK